VAFLRVTLPMAWPGIVAGALLTFVPALGDYVNAEFLGATGQTMIGNVVQSKFLVVGDYPGAAALGFMLMSATGLLLGVTALLLRAQSRGRA
jgi:spermidine/putrescine transport system permease protein